MPRGKMLRFGVRLPPARAGLPRFDRPCLKSIISPDGSLVPVGGFSRGRWPFAVLFGSDREGPGSP